MVNSVPAACSKAEIALGPRFQAETYLTDEEAAFFWSGLLVRIVRHLAQFRKDNPQPLVPLSARVSPV